MGIDLPHFYTFFEVREVDSLKWKLLAFISTSIQFRNEWKLYMQDDVYYYYHYYYDSRQQWLYNNNKITQGYVIQLY